MTGKDDFTGRKNHGRGHSYWIDGVKVDGVTTVIKKGLPAPALIKWAATCAADEAIDHWDELGQLPLMERHTRLVKAPDNVRDTAGVQGSRVHALAQPLSHGEQVAVPEAIAGYVDSCVQFLDDFDVQPVLTETSVLSHAHSYGGTLDLIADIAGKRWLLDWKTNRKGPYGDTAFQLAAYRYADVYLGRPHGFTIDSPLVELDMIPVDECGVVWLRPDGYDLFPFHADEGVWRQFLYIQQTAHAAADSYDYRGDPLIPPVRAA